MWNALDIVSQKQCHWEQAEKYYRKALTINIEFNDHYAQASTYHQLGRVSQEQFLWAQALDDWLKALAIWLEFKDEHFSQMALRNLARLWHDSGNSDIPAAVAEVIPDMSAEQVTELLTKILKEENSDDDADASSSLFVAGTDHSSLLHAMQATVSEQAMPTLQPNPS